MRTIIDAPLPDISAEDLQAEADRLHDLERKTLLAVGEARLRGLPGEAGLTELRRIREALEGTYAALRLLNATRGVIQ